MDVFSFPLNNQRVSAIKSKILPKTITRCSKEVSAITNVLYKSVCYIEVFL